MTTQNLGLTDLVAGQLQPEVTINGDLNILDAALGAPSGFAWNPTASVALTFGYFGGTVYENGQPVTVAAGTVTLVASTTNYVQRTNQGVVSVNQTGYTQGYVPMATVVTNAGAIIQVTDTRPTDRLGGRSLMNVGAPTGVGVTTSGAAGSIAASLDCTYQVSALYPWGESAASAPVSVTTGTGATNENTISWTLPAQATAAKVYGRTAGGELFIATVNAGTDSYLDTGSVTPAGALPTGTLDLTSAQDNVDTLGIQGVLTANTTIIWPTDPAYPRTVVMSNETTGPYTLTAKTASGNGVTIAQGNGALCYTDGANVYATGNGAGASLSGNNTWSGTNTFGTTLNQTAGQGAGNETPLFQTADGIDDYVVNGLTIPVPSPISPTGDLQTGVAYIIGQRNVLSAAVANTYPQASDTYVDMSNTGVLTYASVANGATEPAVTANSVRLNKVVTSITPPPAAPTLAASTAAGTLAAGTYTYELVGYDGTGNTLPGPSAAITTTATGEVVLTWTVPTNIVSMNVYGRVAGSLGLLASGVTGTTWTDTGAAAVGAAPPTSATSNYISATSQLATTNPITRFTPPNLVTGGEIQSGQFVTAVDSSTIVNSIVLTYNPAVTAWTNLQKLRFQAANTNTAAVTALVNGLAAVDVYSPAGALAGGEIVAGGIYDVIYEASIPALVIVGQTAGIVTTPNAPLLTGNAGGVIIGTDTTGSTGDAAAGSVIIGAGAVGQAGNDCVVIGYGANGGGGNHNVSIGFQATGSQGFNSVAVGYGAGASSGGNENVCVGTNSGSGMTTGSYNTCLGSEAYSAGPTALSYVTALGYNATPTAGNQTVIGSSGNNQYNLVYGGAFQTYNLPNNLTTVGAFTLTSPYAQPDVIVTATQTAAFTVTTDTAANLFAAAGSPPADFGYKFRVINNDQSTTGYDMTIAAGTGVTIGVTANNVIPKGGFGDFVLTFTSATAATLTRVGSGTL
jgi:hypothetical protein